MTAGAVTPDLTDAIGFGDCPYFDLSRRGADPWAMDA